MVGDAALREICACGYAPNGPGADQTFALAARVLLARALGREHARAQQRHRAVAILVL